MGTDKGFAQIPMVRTRNRMHRLIIILVYFSSVVEILEGVHSHFPTRKHAGRLINIICLIHSPRDADIDFLGITSVYFPYLRRQSPLK